MSFTALQGQYLAFIHAYKTLYRRAPAETDFRKFFQVTAPTVHRMILTLQARGLVARTPGEPRSLRLLIPPEQMPPLRPLKDR